jgi:hypothetical protein
MLHDCDAAFRPLVGRVVLLGPVTEFYVAHSWHTTQSFAHEMGLYFLRGRFLSGTGPTWFCAALLMFSGIYAVYEASGVSVALRRSVRPRIATSGVMLTIAAIAISTFLIRIVEPMGTSVFNMQLCYFPSYIIMFGLGVAAVDDLADACAFVLEHYSDEEHVNVGSGAELTIAEFAKLIAEVTGYRGKLVFDPSRPDGMPRKLLDSSKLIGMGWRARTSLRAGLELAYAAFIAGNYRVH